MLYLFIYMNNISLHFNDYEEKCLECRPTRAVHHIKQGVRHLVCVTSSCLNNWITAQVNARQGFKGTDRHVDWEGISEGLVRNLTHML